MDLLAGAGDTWGISGPAFLLLYAIAAIALIVAVLAMRRRIGGSRAVLRDLHPYEAAYLEGGRNRAIAAALAVLRADQAVESAGRARCGRRSTRRCGR